ncbi:hypothetical protein J4P02_00125 [Pseudomonas sp. NFXW11]|uniref:toxin VasX n=1 Tax=Pseudomonas sp. NFXW11 TaxID=2819531 RepID=UPI003CF35AB8
MPYKTISRPLGIRLMRDGWLYVVVDKKPEAVMHEYRIQDGIVTQLLWEKGEITANKRESNVGEEEPKSRIPRRSHATGRDHFNPSGRSKTNK